MVISDIPYQLAHFLKLRGSSPHADGCWWQLDNSCVERYRAIQGYAGSADGHSVSILFVQCSLSEPGRVVHVSEFWS